MSETFKRCEDCPKKEKNKEPYIEVIVHKPDGSEEILEFTYLVGSGVTRGEVVETDKVKKVPMCSIELGCTGITTRAGVHKALIKQVDPKILLLGDLLSDITVRGDE